MTTHELEPMASRVTHVLGVIVGKQIVEAGGPGVRPGQPIHDERAIARVDNTGTLAVGIMVCVHVTDHQHERIAVMLADDIFPLLDLARAELRALMS